jgi:di-heme oxidoreductase (putative peroxidase)
MTEAPTGFDNLSNGFDGQGPPFEQINEDTVVPLRSFNDNRFIFEEVEANADGLGPTYNAQSCRECHQNVVTGGASQVAEHRTGHLEGDQFFESLGGSLIQSRAAHPDIVERVAFEDDIRTFRISTNTLGNGFVECIADATLLAIRDGQPAAMQGTALMVPVLEAGSRPRVGRFGWKSQHASLQSFSADAYLNEMGITSPLFPEENTSSDVDVAPYDPVPDPEDDGVDVVALANFTRSTKAPARAEIVSDTGSPASSVSTGSAAQCAMCLQSRPRDQGPRSTAASSPCRLLSGTKSSIPIVTFSCTISARATASQSCLNLPRRRIKSRTAPLWALRTRNRLMHDGLSFTKQEAIQRHQGQAADVTTAYNALSDEQKSQILTQNSL